ncbi:hypothetical protein KIN20_007672 [Parelaphostrongylus tenuis]|uniref:Uncharacterized protein n=1 Tax=Parelaphostrongylus tenuis TaxID=148309 RepID=A0AAD5MLQ2_PARTN|nr:hypothetical protein KIN20_007672 [Parelaphostrongylus tenuis]
MGIRKLAKSVYQIGMVDLPKEVDQAPLSLSKQLLWGSGDVLPYASSYPTISSQKNYPLQLTKAYI